MAESTPFICTITVEAEPEELTPQREAKQIGDPSFARDVMPRRRRVGLWGWCSAKVTATIDIAGVRYTGHGYLGACSYESDADFVMNSGYFPDLAKEAVAEAMALMDREKVVPLASAGSQKPS